MTQTGRLVIGGDGEIAGIASIDRGALDDTLIGDGGKLDNQIQIGDGLSIDDHAAMAGCLGVVGSSRSGRWCTVGVAGMIIGHLEPGDDVGISAGAMVTRNASRPGQYKSISPIEAHSEWLHKAPQIKRLAKLAERVAGLEKKPGLMEKTS